MTSFKFRVVLCRIRPFTPLFSKIKWLKSGLPFFPCFILWNDHGTNDSYFLSLTDALSDQPNVKSLSDMKPGIISKKSTRIDFQTSKHPLRGAKNEFGPAAFFKLELEKFYFLFSSVQSRTDRNWTLFYPLRVQNAHFDQEITEIFGK